MRIPAYPVGLLMHVAQTKIANPDAMFIAHIALKLRDPTIPIGAAAGWAHLDFVKLFATLWGALTNAAVLSSNPNELLDTPNPLRLSTDDNP